MGALPKYVNVTKVVTYTVASVMQDMMEENGVQPTFDEIMTRITSYAEDDFSCGWGHKADVDELIYTDENGEEV